MENNSIEKTRKSSLVSNLILLSLSLLISALFAEAVLRWTMADRIVLFPRFHAAASYGDYILRRTQPNLHFTHTSLDGRWDYRINAQGFRDDNDYTHAKPAGTFRVLTLGDSHTMGYEVRQEAGFTEIMERRLRDLGLPAEVLNTGVSGFSTAEALAFLENEGLKYDPDMVVLAFFRNDFEDNLKAGLFRVEHNELVEGRKQHVPGVRALGTVNSVPGFTWLSQNSYLYSVALNTAWNTAKRALLDRAVADLSTEYAVGVQEVTAEMNRLALRLIERMHAVTRARGIPLVILEIPTTPAERDFATSIPTVLHDHMRANSELFISADSVLAPYRGLVEFHVPHGHRHISEFSHLMLGKAAAEQIAKLKGLQPATAGKPLAAANTGSEDTGGR